MSDEISGVAARRRRRTGPTTTNTERPRMQPHDGRRNRVSTTQYQKSVHRSNPTRRRIIGFINSKAVLLFCQCATGEERGVVNSVAHVLRKLLRSVTSPRLNTVLVLPTTRSVVWSVFPSPSCSPPSSMVYSPATSCSLRGTAQHGRRHRQQHRARGPGCHAVDPAVL